MDRLTAIGFRHVGRWVATANGIEFELWDCADSNNLLYSFISNGVVLYVGKTVQPLKKRMYGYQNPGPSQSTNIKGNHNIRDVLADGDHVDIYALPDDGLLHFGAFHINLAAGLEDSIIKTLNPDWNRSGKMKAVGTTRASGSDKS